jgi:hypothetical protein
VFGLCVSLALLLADGNVFEVRTSRLHSHRGSSSTESMHCPTLVRSLGVHDDLLGA